MLVYLRLVPSETNVSDTEFVFLQIRELRRVVAEQSPSGYVTGGSRAEQLSYVRGCLRLRFSQSNKQNSGERCLFIKAVVLSVVSLEHLEQNDDTGKLTS